MQKLLLVRRDLIVSGPLSLYMICGRTVMMKDAFVADALGRLKNVLAVIGGHRCGFQSQLGVFFWTCLQTERF